MRRAALLPPVAFLAIILFVSACGGDYEDPDAIVRDTLAVDTTAALAGDDLRSTLESDGRFTSFVAAIDSSGLGSTFEGQVPVTIFAPTDDAFSELGEDERAEFFLPANRDRLRDIVMHHVVNGRRMSSDLRGVESIETMYGESLALRANNAGTQIGEAQVVYPNIEARNGVIHAIDIVMIPSDLD